MKTELLKLVEETLSEASETFPKTYLYIDNEKNISVVGVKVNTYDEYMEQFDKYDNYITYRVEHADKFTISFKGIVDSDEYFKRFIDEYIEDNNKDVNDKKTYLKDRKLFSNFMKSISKETSEFSPSKYLHFFYIEDMVLDNLKNEKASSSPKYEDSESLPELPEPYYKASGSNTNEGIIKKITKKGNKLVIDFDVEFVVHEFNIDID